MLSNRKIIIISLVILIILISGGYIILSSDSENPVKIDNDMLVFEDTEKVFDITEGALGEDIEHTGRIDGQLLVADASDFVDINQINVADYEWRTEGVTYNSEEIIHYYEESGSYELELTVTTNTGDSYSDEVEVETRGILIENVDEDEMVYQYSAPQTAFDSDSVSYEWDVGFDFEERITGEEVTVDYEVNPGGMRNIKLFVHHDDYDEPIVRRTTIIPDPDHEIPENN